MFLSVHQKPYELVSLFPSHEEVDSPARSVL